MWILIACGFDGARRLSDGPGDPRSCGWQNCRRAGMWSVRQAHSFLGLIAALWSDAGMADRVAGKAFREMVGPEGFEPPTTPL